MTDGSGRFERRKTLTRLVIACLALALATPAAVGAVALRPETLRAYGQYVGAVLKRFEERASAGAALADFSPAEAAPGVRDGHVVVQPASEDGIVDAPGGLIHHWRGLAFIPRVSLQAAIVVSQDYANYKRVYRPVLDARSLERNGDTFRVLVRIQKSSGPISAVLDVWSIVRYKWKGDDLVYSVSDSERIVEVKNPGKRDERGLPPDEGRGYLWRANTFSRFAERDGGVLVEIENVGLSRRFPAMLGWIIEPIARRLGRSSVEDSLVEFRAAVVAAHDARTPATTDR